MVGTRAGDTKRRAVTRRGSAPSSEETAVPCLNAPSPPSFSSLDPDAPPTVALAVTGDWSRPPSIGQIEAALTSNGRTQHRIWRIDVGAESAVVHVHPDDVAGCVGILYAGNMQLNVSVMSGPVDPGIGLGAGTAAAITARTVTAGAGPSASQPMVATTVVKAVPSPVPAMVAPGPPKKRAKLDGPMTVSAVQPPQPSPQLYEAISDQLLGDGYIADEMPQQETLLAMRAPPQLALAASSNHLPVLGTNRAPKIDSAALQRQKDAEEKQRRHYRVGLSYRCGRCGKPKKGHICDQPEDGEGMPLDTGPQLSPAPAILATTVRKGTPPALLNSPLHAGSPLVAASPRNGVAVASTLADVKVSGEANTIFKDMVAALGDSVSPTGISPNGSLVSPGSGGPPPPQLATTGISPLAASAIAAGSVSSVAAGGPNAAAVVPGSEPQLSEMDLMLADLAFAARPPPVMTPDEGGTEALANGLGSLSPSNFSPGTMIQQLITTPNQSNGWSATQLAELSQVPQVASVRRNPVIAQPSA